MGGQLHVTLQQRLENLVIVIERGVREDLHAHGAVHLGIHALGQQRCGDAFRVTVSVGHVAELYDDLVAFTGREGRGCRHGKCDGRDGGSDKFHLVFLPYVRALPNDGQKRSCGCTSANRKNHVFAKIS